MEVDETFEGLFNLTCGKSQYGYQKRLIETLKENNYIIINKSRQVGISFWFALYALLHALKGRTVLIVSPSERQSKHFLGYAKQFLSSVKQNITVKTRIDIVVESKTELFLANGGKIYSLPNSPNSTRGIKADVAIFDEYAHFLCGTDKENMEAILPSLSRGGKLILISTPFGEGNEFYNTWMHAEEMGFKPVLINWKECPDFYQDGETEGIQKIKRFLDEDSFKQEYDNTFLGDATSEFSYNLIKTCVNPNLQYDPNPKSDELYLGMDVGRHKHLSVLAWLEKNEEKFILRNLDVWKNTPFTAQENNINEVLRKNKVVNMNIDKMGLGEEMSERLHDIYPDIINPFVMSNESKHDLVTYLKKLFEDKKIEIPDDSFLINSIHQIQRSKNQSTGYTRYDAEESKETGHADAFWALALAALATKGEKDFDFVTLDL